VKPLANLNAGVKDVGLVALKEKKTAVVAWEWYHQATLIALWQRCMATLSPSRT
jgi:hypothetical protein